MTGQAVNVVGPAIGGVPVVMKALLDAGLLHGDVLTVTGKTMAENLERISPPDVDGKVLRAMADPIHRTGGITVLGGSLAPEGAVVKSAGFDTDVFTGTARVFDRERAALDALAVGGRAVFMAYQSLEDRIVKRALAQRSRSRSPQDLPVELPGTGPEFRLITRGAERATEQEMSENPRSAPVRLRCAQRIAGS